MLAFDRLLSIINRFVFPPLFLILGGFGAYKIITILLLNPEFLTVLQQIQETSEPGAISYLATRLAILLCAASFMPYLLFKLLKAIFNYQENRENLKKEWNTETK